MTSRPRVTLLLLPMLSFLCHAQTVGTGPYPFKSSEIKSLDEITPGNLNVHFAIPIVRKAGRGLDFNYDVSYDSLVWAPVISNGVTSWQPASAWGFKGLSDGGFVGSISYSYSVSPCPGGGLAANWSNFIYQDPQGANHAFNFVQNLPCGSQAYQFTGDGSSADGSGYSISQDQLVHTLDGRTISTSNIQANGGYVQDRNGNSINQNIVSTIVDTLGINALTKTSGGGNSLTGTLTYPVTNQSNGANSATATAYYRAYTIQTNFGCPGIVEQGAHTDTLVDHITLPDNSSDTYTFTYEPTQGITGGVTGRIASITLPTGGTIAYSYTGGCSGSGIYSDGSPATLTRTTSDGSKSYARSVGSTSTTTTIVDEAQNVSVMTFVNNGLYETELKVWQGSNTSANPLLDRTTLYNQQTGIGPFSMPITQADVYEVFNTANAQPVTTQLRTTSLYTTTGLLTKRIKTNTTTNSVLGSAEYTYNSLDKLASSNTYDGAHILVTSSTFGYDETTPLATSGLPRHTAGSSQRGNQTSSHVMTASGSTLDSTMTYDDAGQVHTITTPNGPTTFSYDPTDTFRTTTALPRPSSGVQLATSAAYDASSGVQSMVVGMNNETTQTTQYDPLLRPRIVSAPDGGQATYTYGTNQAGISFKMDGTHNTDQESLYDGYGRLSRTLVYNGQTSNPYYLADYCYNAVGLLQFKSTRYSSTGFNSAKQCSGAGDTFIYDALGRPANVVHADGSSTAYTYFSRAAKRVDSPGSAKIIQFDLLGRLAAVCELSSNSSMPASGYPAPCGTDIAGNGFLTNYAYDLSNHKVTVTQGAQARVFQTDAAGRKILVQEPESGTTIYNYAYNSTGLVTTRIRPRANQTNPGVTTHTVTQYDKLGRVANVTYDDGTPTKTFYYDQLANHDVISNGGATVGQMTAMTNGVHAVQLAYDIMGRVSETAECLPDWCSLGVSRDPYRWYSYDYLGNLKTEQYSTAPSGQGVVSLSYGYNQAGQLTSISGGQNDSVLSPTLYSASQMGPFGKIVAQLGNGLNTPFQYDQVGRVSGGWACAGSNQPGCPGGAMRYGFLNTTVGAQVQQVSDIVLQRTSNYGYDEFNRLTSSSNTNVGEPPLSMSLTYDRYGNRWAESVSSSGPVPNTSFSFNAGTNQITGFTYDAVGNLLNDGVHTYQYDAENNLVSIDNGSTATYAYDALNRRVKAATSNSIDRYSLDLAGRRSITWQDGSNATVKLAQYYGDKGPVAFWASADNHAHFEHGDWLGTERTRTDRNGNVEMTSASLPFGERVGGSGADLSPNHFALLDQDLAPSAGLSHAGLREYSSIQGRWFSTDPDDRSYDRSSPQSMNRYVYALNNPLVYTDPNGDDSSDDWAAYDARQTAFGGSSHGGSNSLEDYFQASLAANLGGTTTDHGAPLDPNGLDPFHVESDLASWDKLLAHIPQTGPTSPTGYDFVFHGGDGSLKERDSEWVAIQLGTAISAGDDPRQIATTIQYIYDNLELYSGNQAAYPGGLHGGNWNYSAQIGESNVIDFFHDGRNGILPSVHIEGDHFHVDTANGSSVAGPIHWVWDVGFGNTIFRAGIPR